MFQPRAHAVQELHQRARAAPGTRSGRGSRSSPPARGRRPGGARAASPSRCRTGRRPRSARAASSREQLARSRARLATSMPTKMCATLRVGVAVVELGDRALAEQRAELAEAARAARGSSPRGSPRAARPARRARRRSAAGRSSCWRRRRSPRRCGPSRGAARTHALTPAIASAPAGSRIERVSSNTSLIAAQIASVSTSDHVVDAARRARRNVSSPTCLTATPSANRPDVRQRARAARPRASASSRRSRPAARR